MKSKDAESTVLTLFGRQGCHLCEDMQVALVDYQQELGFTVHWCDIDQEPQLFERYNLQVPVLTDGECEICHFFLDVAALRNHFSTAS